MKDSQYSLVRLNESELIKQWGVIRSIIAMGMCREHLDESIYRRMLSGLTAGHLQFWAIMANDQEQPRLIGGVTTAFMMDPFLREIVLSVYSIYTAEQVEWSNFADQCLSEVIDFAKSKKCCRVVAQCNEASELFAKRQGFRKDAVLMSLELSG